MTFKKTSVAKTKVEETKKKKKEVILTKEDERALAKVADPALRDVLKAFRMRCYQE